jgi:hypothetical protein
LLAACGAGVIEEDTPAPTPYESACLAAVADRTGVSGASLASSSLSEVNDTATVMVNVPGAAAPWVCDSSANGTVRRVEFSGVEGAL